MGSVTALDAEHAYILLHKIRGLASINTTILNILAIITNTRTQDASPKKTADKLHISILSPLFQFVNTGRA